MDKVERTPDTRVEPIVRYHGIENLLDSVY